MGARVGTVWGQGRERVKGQGWERVGGWGWGMEGSVWGMGDGGDGDGGIANFQARLCIEYMNVRPITTACSILLDSLRPFEFALCDKDCAAPMQGWHVRIRKSSTVHTFQIHAIAFASCSTLTVSAIVVAG